MDDIIKTWPESIWLQACDDDSESLPEFKPYSEITWCQDQQGDSDIGYVRADLVAELRARIAELETQLAESRENERTSKEYLSNIRALVAGINFPQMVQRIEELEARQVPEGWQAVPILAAPSPADSAKNPDLTYCSVINDHKSKCQLHNLQCAYPHCLRADSGEVKP